MDWCTLGELTLALVSLLDAVLLYLMATTATIVMGYTGYLVFRATFQMMITVARSVIVMMMMMMMMVMMMMVVMSVPSFEIARHISPSSYGLVFGLNTFLALGFQTILTTIVADSAGLALEPRPQVRCKYFLFGLNIFPSSECTRGSSW